MTPIVDHADDSDRRFRLFSCEAGQVLQLMNQASIPPEGGRYLLPKIRCLPPGYRVKTVFFDYSLQAFVFVVCHPSWKLVADHGKRPEIEPFLFEMVSPQS